MEQLNLKLKVITDTVKIAEKICQNDNKSRLDKRTPLTTFHQGQKVLYFQLPAQGTCSKLSPRFNQIYEIISIDPLYQTAQLRDSNGAILSKKVHLSKLKPYFQRDHSTDHPSSAPSVDTTAPRQINLPVQTTVANNISIQTPVTHSTTSMITQPPVALEHGTIPAPRHHRSIQATRPGPTRTNQLQFVQYNTTSLSLPALAQRQSVLICLPQTLSDGALVSVTDHMLRYIHTSDHPEPRVDDISRPLDIFFLSNVFTSSLANAQFPGTPL